jgi:flagellar hook assembly protein FlgD
MTRMLALLGAASVLGCLLWLPAVGAALATELAEAPDTVLVEQQLPAAAPNQARTVTLPIRANMVGASWEGSSDEIELRAKGADGAWSEWVTLHASHDEGPDPGSAEAENASARHALPVPVWVGDAEQVELRGAGKDVELVSINTTGTADASDRAVTGLRESASDALEGLGVESQSDAAQAAPAMPDIITRAEWDADESIRRAAPSYAPELKGAVIHHTVNSNSYSRGDAAALVRGIYTYHVKSNGWNDIGYNFLVDRFGRIYQGRAGDMTRPAIGAHTGGYNSGTAGVALLGTHTSTSPSSAARAGVKRILSWRLDKAHVRPTANISINGETKRAVSGHRDFMSTSCPGSSAYSLINTLRTDAWTMDGPKFASPSASLDLGAGYAVDDATFTATGNRTLTYSLKLIRRSDQQLLRTITQTGTNANITWDGTTPGFGMVPAWNIDWLLEASSAGVSATPFRRQLFVAPPPPDLRLRGRSDLFLSPNGDGLGDTSTFRYSIAGRAYLTAQIVDANNHGAVVRTLFSDRLSNAGTHTVTWDGTVGGAPAPNDSYDLRLFARDPLDGRDEDDLRFDKIELDRTIALRGLPAAFSPNGDERRDRLFVGASTTQARTITVTVRAGTTTHRTLYNGALNGSSSWAFDGRNTGGAKLPDGSYTVRLSSNLPGGLYVLQRVVRIDTVVPSGSARRVRGGLRLWVSERVKVTARVRRSDGSTTIRSRWFSRGLHTTTAFPGASRLSFVDLALNRRRVSVQ